MDVSELKEALKMLGIDKVKDEDLDLLVNHFDADHSGTIDRDEFINMVLVCVCVCECVRVHLQ